MSVIRKLDRDPIVAFHVAYAKLPGSDPMCALFLSQVSYWCSRAEDGVAWITHQAMYEQTGMSRKQQDRSAAHWESVGVMKKFIKGIPPKIHYFIDYERLEQLLMEGPDGQVDVSERGILDVQNGHHVMSERGKTSSRDSKDSQRVSGDLHARAAKQHPEKEAEPQTEAPSSQIAAHAQASDAALTPKQQTPSPHLAGPPSPKTCEPRLDLPRHLDTPAFREAWAEFEQHRKQIKAPLTDLARRKLVKKLSSFDEQTCIQAFDASISSAWSGVFPESVKSGKRAPQQVHSMNRI